MRVIKQFITDEKEALLLTRDLYEFDILARMYKCKEDDAPAPYLVTEEPPLDMENNWQLAFDPDTQDLVETARYTGRERRKSKRVEIRMPIEAVRIARH